MAKTTKANKRAAPKARKSAAAPKAGGFKAGDRVTVTGSFAARQLGTVSALDAAGGVLVRLDHKQADKVFKAADLAPA